MHALFGRDHGALRLGQFQVTRNLGLLVVALGSSKPIRCGEMEQKLGRYSPPQW